MYPFEHWFQNARQYCEQYGRPLVSLCYAQSLDGSLTAQRGKMMPLSDFLANRLTQQIRAAHQGILIGVNTVLSDDPQLTVRLVTGPDPQPIILDSRLRIPLEARLLQAGRHAPKPWIATTSLAKQARIDELQSRGAQILHTPADPQGRVDLPALLSRLASLGIHSLMVEGGAQVITSFLSQGLADLAVITISPCLVGGWNVVETGRLAPGTRPVDFPHLVESGSEWLGENLVVWGKLKFSPKG